MAKKVTLKKDRALKYINEMESWSNKVMTVNDLSLKVGVFDDVIANELALFDPLIRLYPDYNILQLLPELKKKYVVRKRRPSRINVIADEYESIGDFVYQNMTMAGGIIDRNIVLSKDQLKVLRKLINQELKK